MHAKAKTVGRSRSVPATTVVDSVKHVKKTRYREPRTQQNLNSCQKHKTRRQKTATVTHIHYRSCKNRPPMIHAPSTPGYQKRRKSGLSSDATRWPHQNRCDRSPGKADTKNTGVSPDTPRSFKQHNRGTIKNTWLCRVFFGRRCDSNTHRYDDRTTRRDGVICKEPAWYRF